MLKCGRASGRIKRGDMSHLDVSAMDDASSGVQGKLRMMVMMMMIMMMMMSKQIGHPSDALPLPVFSPSSIGHTGRPRPSHQLVCDPRCSLILADCYLRP